MTCAIIPGLVACNVIPMSQSVSNRSSVLDPDLDLAEPADAVVDAVADLRFDFSQTITSVTMQTNADELMDALFADVDRMLERGVVVEPLLDAPVEPAEPAAGETAEAASLESVIALDALLPPKLSPRDLVPQPLDLFEPEPELEPKPEPATSQKKSPLWLAVLCSSLLLSAGILSFLFRHQVTDLWLGLIEQYLPAAPVAVAPSPPAAKNESRETKPEDSDFLDYLKRSVDRLARYPQASPSPSASPTIVAVSPMPVLTVVPSTANTSSNPGQVYVPVYPPANSAATGAQPASPAQPVKPAPASQSSSPVNSSPSVTPVPNIATVNNHTLVGILELGERSAALFEVDGIPQRIEIGAQVGSSGWMLVSISNQEAIVRRNGEVRSIYVGQKF
jgi:hypothetical protein